MEKRNSRDTIRHNNLVSLAENLMYQDLENGIFMGSQKYVQLSYTWNKMLKRELVPLENTRKCSGLNFGAPRKVDSTYSDAQELTGQKVGAVMHQRQSRDDSGKSSVQLITDKKIKMCEL